MRPGFFSTDSIAFDQSNDMIRMMKALKRSFQITPENYVPIDSAGQAVAGVGFAMDDALQQSKLINASGGYIPLGQLEWYGGQGFIGWQLCAVLAQNWLIDKAVTMPAKDAMRNGWEANADGGDVELAPEVFDYIKRLNKKFLIDKNCIEFVKMGRTFGIRHALFMYDGVDYEAPFNPDGIRPGAYNGITQIDPYWLAPELDLSSAANPASPGFYEPTWWRVNGKRVHKSHFVIMRNGDQVADILKPSYFYGGIPTPQKIYERVYAAERTANEAPLLAMSKRLTSLRIDIVNALSDPAKLQQKMQEWSALMNNFGIKVIGEGEEIQQFDTNLSNFDETIMTQYQLVAAASNVPATKLLGTTPKGFNSSGNYEEASYHEELESLQENDLSPLIERHLLLLMRSYIAPKFGITAVNLEVNWNPVDSPTAAELADINQKKGAYYNSLNGLGAVDGYDVRQAIIKDKDSGFTGIADMVPGGVGDREAQQEKEAALLESETANENPDEKKTSMGSEAQA